MLQWFEILKWMVKINFWWLSHSWLWFVQLKCSIDLFLIFFCIKLTYSTNYVECHRVLHYRKMVSCEQWNVGSWIDALLRMCEWNSRSYSSHRVAELLFLHLAAHKRIFSSYFFVLVNYRNYIVLLFFIFSVNRELWELAINEKIELITCLQLFHLRS